MTRTSTLISGIVEDTNGRPIAQARVYFISAPATLPDIAILTNEDGAFSLPAPSKGVYQLGIAADGYVPASVTAIVKGDHEATLWLQLSPAAD